MKRIQSAIIAFCMIFTMIGGVMPITVQAAEQTPTVQSYEFRIVSPYYRGQSSTRNQSYAYEQVTSYDMIDTFISQTSQGYPDQAEGRMEYSDYWKYAGSGGKLIGGKLYFTDDAGGIYLQNVGDWGSFMIKVDATGNYDLSSRMRFNPSMGTIVEVYLASASEISSAADSIAAKYLIGTVDTVSNRTGALGGDSSVPLATNSALAAGEYYITFKNKEASTAAASAAYIQNFKITPYDVNAEKSLAPVFTPEETDFDELISVSLDAANQNYTSSTYAKPRAFYKTGVDSYWNDPTSVIRMSTVTVSTDNNYNPIAIDITDTTKISAVATDYIGQNGASSFKAPSDPVTVTYTKVEPTYVKKPTASLESGNYTELKAVTLSTTTSGAEIYYTTDGSDPTKESTKYTGEILLDKSMTIKAIGIKEGLDSSEIATFTYNIDLSSAIPTIQSYEFRIVSPYWRGLGAKHSEYAMDQVTSYSMVPQLAAQIKGGNDDGAEGKLTTSAEWKYAGANVKTGKLMFFDEDGGVRLENIGDWGSFLVKVDASGNYDLSTRVRFNAAYGTITEVYLAPKREVASAEESINEKYLLGTIDQHTNRTGTYGDSSVPLASNYALNAGEYYFTYKIKEASTAASYISYIQNFKIIPHNENAEKSTAPVIKPDETTFVDSATITVDAATNSGANTYAKSRAFYKTGVEDYYDDPTSVIRLGTTVVITNSTDLSPLAFDIAETTTVSAVAIDYIGKSGASSFKAPSDPLTVTYLQQANVPVASCASGKYSIIRNIVLSAQNDGADIYYTTDGSDPTRESTKYESPIVLDKSMTLKAIAVKENFADSEIVTYDYQVELAVLEPTVTPSAGSFTGMISVSINCATEGATIYYTLDGSNPTRESKEYTGAFNLNKSATLKAFAVKDGMPDSPIMTAEFTQQTSSGGMGGGSSFGGKAIASAPSANIPGGTYTETKSIELKSSTSGAVIYYTTDGSTPTTSSTKYESPIVVDKSMKIKAIAVADNMYNSDVSTFSYTINIDLSQSNTVYFNDVPYSAWYYDAVSFVAGNGIIKGIAENEFGPNIATTRAMLATIIHRMAGSPVAESKAPFDDVADEDWFAASVAWASETGVVNGVGDAMFAPINYITREQLCVMLVRYAEDAGIVIPQGEDVVFADADSISEYAKDAVSIMSSAGIVNGKSGGKFDPQGIATRAEVATIIYRFIEVTQIVTE